MNFLWLEDFLTLAATGNFSRAAEERHMTQPAFSRRIRALEEWLGVVLIDRTTHPAVLTEAGEWFRSVAQDLLSRVAQLPDEARAIADATSATLRIASTHALSFTFLPSWLRSLESRAPMGPVQLASDVLQACEALMTQGRVQFLLCHAHDQVPTPLDAAHYRSAVVGTDELLPVSAPAAGSTPKFALAAGGPRRVPVLAYSAESGIGRLVRLTLQLKTRSPSASPRSSSSRSTKRHASTSTISTRSSKARSTTRPASWATSRRPATSRSTR